MAAKVENTLEKINSFSVSAISNSMLEQKYETLKTLENRLKLLQSNLNGSPEIKNDLQVKVLECQQVRIICKSD